MTNERILVGLGNPGPAYRGSRHNAGALVVQHLARTAGIRMARTVGPARAGEGRLRGAPVVVGLPQTFMNGSGDAVTALLARWPVPLEQLMIVCDDVALPYGAVRIRPGGSDGGHRGLRSVTEALGRQTYPRLRVGIDGPARGPALEEYVLGPWTAAERRQWPDVAAMAVAACTLWVEQGIAAAMTRFNRTRRG